MALVESHDCNREASGCAIRSFLVCFWYDFNAALKIAWKREEAVGVKGVWDMGKVATVEESRIICLQVRVGTVGRWCTRLIVKPPNKASVSANANVDVTIGAEIDARTDRDAVRRPDHRDVEERISRGFALMPPTRFTWDYYTQSKELTEHRTMTVSTHLDNLERTQT